MSLKAMKQALATIDKIIDGCNNVQEEKDIHGDAKTLAKLIKKDCFPTLEALCQAIAEAEKRKWVGLTNEEITNLFFDGDSNIGVKTMSASDVWRIKRTEYLLRGKNT